MRIADRKVQSRKNILASIVALLLMAVAVPAFADTPSNSTTFTVSTVDSLVFNAATTTTLVGTQTNATEILGRLNGGTPLFDQTFSDSYSSATVQAGVQAARLAITSAGGPGVIISGPTLISHTSTTSTVSSSTVYSVDHATVLAPITTQYVGPADIVVGAVSDCSSTVAALPSGSKPVCSSGGAPWHLYFGGVNYDTVSATTYYIDQVTTLVNDTTVTDIYALDGTVQRLGTVHTVTPAAAFDLADRFGRRLLDAGTDVEPALDARMGSIAPPPWHGFAESYGFFAHQGNDGDIPGNTRTAYGGDGGLSFDLTDTLTVGAAFDFGHDNIDLDAVNESAHLNLSQGGLWANWRSGQAFASIAGTFGGGNASTSSDPAGLGMTSSADYHLTVAGISAEAGYHFDVEQIVLTPTVGASYSHVRRGGFTESGSILALAAPAAEYDRTKVWIGMNLQGQMAFDNGMNLTTTVYGRAINFGGDRHLDAAAGFDAGGGLLTISDVGSSAFGADLGASLALAFTKTASAYINYDARLRDSNISNAVTGGLKVSW